MTERSCDCGNGKTLCPRCQGRGDLPCEAFTACAACRDSGSCLRCEGTGRRINQNPRDHKPGDERITCRQCGAGDAACPTCSGQGRTTCSTCEGRGTRGCPDCDRTGTVTHERCEGTGQTVTWIEGTISRQPLIEKIRFGAVVTVGLRRLMRLPRKGDEMSVSGWGRWARGPSQPCAVRLVVETRPQRLQVHARCE